MENSILRDRPSEDYVICLFFHFYREPRPSFVGNFKNQNKKGHDVQILKTFYRRSQAKK